MAGRVPDLNRLGKLVGGTALVGGTGLAGYTYGGMRGVEQGRREGFRRGYQKAMQEQKTNDPAAQMMQQQTSAPSTNKMDQPTPDPAARTMQRQVPDEANEVDQPKSRKIASADKILKEAAGAGQVMDMVYNTGKKMWDKLPDLGSFKTQSRAGKTSDEAFIADEAGNVEIPKSEQGAMVPYSGSSNGFEMPDINRDQLIGLGAGGAAGGLAGMSLSDSDQEDFSYKKASNEVSKEAAGGGGRLADYLMRANYLPFGKTPEKADEVFTVDPSGNVTPPKNVDAGQSSTSNAGGSSSESDEVETVTPEVEGASPSGGGDDSVTALTTTESGGGGGSEASGFLSNIDRNTLLTGGAIAGGVGAGGLGYNYMKDNPYKYDMSDSPPKTASNEKYKVQKQGQGYVIVNTKTDEIVSDKPYASEKDARRKKDIMEKGDQPDILLRKQAKPEDNMKSRIRNATKRRHRNERLDRREQREDNTATGGIVGGLTGGLTSPIVGNMLPKRFENAGRMAAPAAGVLAGGSAGQLFSKPRLKPIEKSEIEVEEMKTPKSKDNVMSSYRAETPSGQAYGYDVARPDARQKGSEVDRDQTGGMTQ